MVGFGRRVTWTSDLVVPPGHQMTFKDALHILSTNLVQKLIVPSWAKNLTKRLRNVELAFTELKVCFRVVLFVYVLFMPDISSSNTCWKWWKLAGMGIK
jgi:hypothetical protein